ncbi:hypothetical protein TUM19329_02940 [Legionella antarctica]|uniref:Uncharacterized protein n=1 Tax=Legionella antarctica TaxID=2708020 RepID=A0A6F8T131_9GAMM|nr:hypothetical protein [Legionella antarctica]BCA93933.1 hypothetical protein TUM19329_02940 [Legionella antarctica]
MNKFLRVCAPILIIIASFSTYAAEPLQHGEAYVTRFSGTIPDDNKNRAVINVDGTVGSIINVSAPKPPPQGQHWIDEPQRLPIKAKNAGQIFGIAIDYSKPAVVYVTATSKFGLHRTKDNLGWMPGMWGINGGPGTIYRLQAANDYQPEIFAEVTLNGRKNTGAALGNITYDKQHKQLYVSDLETGMIHRIDAKTGKELELFDHGKDGRSSYVGITGDKAPPLTAISFDPTSKANINQCPQQFDTSPECWNLADPRRRVWGLGVHADKNGNQRLYYSAMVNKEDKQSSIWSIAINKDGTFDTRDVRHELVLPSHTGTNELYVSDIAFSNKNEMIVVENGQLRNLGLEVDEPFSQPFDARAFLYKLNGKNHWELQGRYDIGNISKANNEYTNAAGGTDFGVNDQDENQFVWFSGDALCSETGPCYDPQTQNYTDTDEVHGLQGMKKGAYIPLNTKEPVYVSETYMIDTDLNAGANGTQLHTEAQKNDATKIGDVEIVKYISPVHIVTPIVNNIPSGHNKSLSTPFHDRALSHYRSSSHEVLLSHHRYGSHHRLDSHYRLWSHNRNYSHRKYSSHLKSASHSKFGSHDKRASHLKFGSHDKRASHLKVGSHDKKASHLKVGSHDKRASHLKVGSHDKKASHLKIGSHDKRASHLKVGSHDKRASHLKTGSHDKRASHLKVGSHNKAASHLKVGSHNKAASHLKVGSHNKAASHLKVGSHNKAASHLKVGSHNKAASHLKRGSHSKSVSQLKRGPQNGYYPQQR